MGEYTAEMPVRWAELARYGTDEEVAESVFRKGLSSRSKIDMCNIDLKILRPQIPSSDSRSIAELVRGEYTLDSSGRRQALRHYPTTIPKHTTLSPNQHC